MFTLYRNLVGPFQEFENQLNSKRKLEWELEREAKNAKETISFNYKRTIQKAFSHTIIWAIPFLIVFWVIGNAIQVKGEKLFYYYDEPVEEVLGTIEVMFFEGSALYEIVAIIIICVPLPCLLFLFPLMIVGNAISEARRISKMKKKKEESIKACETYKEQLPQAEAALQKAWQRIAPYVKYIPPDYRNSSALAFFSKSFFNYKVKNLQEAVNLYDQYLHQKEMEQRQREIIKAQREAQKESMDAIDALSRQMAYMQDQIEDQIDLLHYRYY